MITIESVIEKIKRYPKRTQFMANCKLEYAWMRQQNLMHVLDELRPRLNAIKDVIDLDYVMERVALCSNYSDFQRRYFRLYTWAKQNGCIDQVEAALPPVSYDERARRSALAKAYTDDELVQHAANYATREAWRAAGEQERLTGTYSHYGAAIHRGRAFMARCCGHMPHGQTGNTNRQCHTDTDLLEDAKRFQHRSDWKKGSYNQYQAAQNRPELFKQATAHMTPKANPYAGDYVVYAFEFTDRHAYVGLTFLPQQRLSQHLCRGPVFDHIAVCPGYSHKMLASAIGSPGEVIAVEKQWIDRYRSDGWTMLNTSNGGGLGTLVRQWTKELIVAQALKYQTKQQWIDGSQMSYRIAKREGWFDEAADHMPKRDARSLVGRKVTEETRRKQSEAKLGRAQGPDERNKRSEAIRRWWAARRANPVSRQP